MDAVRKLDNKQMMMLASSSLIVANMLSLPSTLAKASAQDTLFVFAFATLYALAVAFLLYRLAAAVPGKNIFDISYELCGRGVGGLLNFLLTAYLLYDLARLIRLYADYFNSSILLRTPKEFIAVIFVSLLVYYGRGTIEHVARTNELFFPLFVLLNILQPIFIINEINLNFLQPALAEGWKHPVLGGIVSFGAFDDLIVFGAFLNSIRQAKGFYFSMKLAVALSAVTLTIWIFLFLTVISPMTAGKVNYIGWVLVQQVHVTDFLDRVDLLLISIWMPISLIKMITLYFAVLHGIASFTKTKSYREYNSMLGLLVVILSMVSFRNVIDAIEFSDFGILPLSIAVQFIVFAVLFAALRRKQATMPICRNDRASGTGRSWLAMAGCMGSIAFGLMFSHYRGMYGNISIVAYLSLMGLYMVFVYREYRSINGI